MLSIQYHALLDDFIGNLRCLYVLIGISTQGFTLGCLSYFYFRLYKMSTNKNVPIISSVYPLIRARMNGEK